MEFVTPVEVVVFSSVPALSFDTHTCLEMLLDYKMKSLGGGLKHTWLLCDV